METVSLWQQRVHDWHVAMGLPTQVGALAGDLLGLRIRLIDEERAELAKARYDGDVIETIDALCDLAFVLLGACDVASRVCRPRYQLLLETTRVRGWSGFNSTLAREIGLLSDVVNATLDLMRQHHAQGSEFKRFDLIDSCMIQLAHACSATGIDIRPHFDEVADANDRKADGPIDEHGKKRKPPGWVGPDHARLLNQRCFGAVKAP